jgi:hypothetical protein
MPTSTLGTAMAQCKYSDPKLKVAKGTGLVQRITETKRLTTRGVKSF